MDVLYTVTASGSFPAHAIGLDQGEALYHTRVTREVAARSETEAGVLACTIIENDCAARETHVVRCQLIDPAPTPVSDLLRLGWCQNAHARDRRGYPVEARAAEAVAWSIYGAAARIYGGIMGPDAQSLLSRFCLTLNKLSPAMTTAGEYNDTPGRQAREIITLAHGAERVMVNLPALYLWPDYPAPNGTNFTLSPPEEGS